MLDESIRQLVKFTAPLLREHGFALSRHFYTNLFERYPELIPMFNQANQKSQCQQQSFALVMTAWAEHIDQPAVLDPVLQMVANKHVSLGVLPEHYAMVRVQWLATLKNVLGDQASVAVLDAWSVAYDELAQILIGLEQNYYQSIMAQDGGWIGWRGFRVTRKVAESEEITSFYLAPVDGGEVPGYRPGQHIALRLFVPELGILQPRQYSLSAAPGGQQFRISVKRETWGDQAGAGVVGGNLARYLEEGAAIDITPPMGDFFLHEDRNTPVVLISAGVGVTPMLAMLEHLINQGSTRQIRFIHACRHGGVHAFKPLIASLAEQNLNVQVVIFYETPRDDDVAGIDYHQAGRIDMGSIGRSFVPPDADFYLCGPLPFMQAHRESLMAQGVSAEAIHAPGGFC
jgi:nitric oxide dioxygenase